MSSNQRRHPLKKIIAVLFILSLLASPCLAAEPLTALHVYFSPKGGCTKAITDAIGQAKQSILVQAYSFTSYPIAQALIDAAKRGVKVEMIIDKRRIHERKVKIGLMAKGGVIVYLDQAHAKAHSKVMIIDGETVITGSFNFTNAAEEKNAENLLILDDAALAAEYMSNWQTHQKHSERYKV